MTVQSATSNSTKQSAGQLVTIINSSAHQLISSPQRTRRRLRFTVSATSRSRRCCRPRGLIYLPWYPFNEEGITCRPTGYHMAPQCSNHGLLECIRSLHGLRSYRPRESGKSQSA
ncbi:hypothetical protein AVEN_188908-1 [Araneus ventricosus]|uniref:Uncharacterized protein n=1 Tax=Araneus ventricosus TaxID=182803 RepID=A0A4Y2V938_ARAVE|nr:hypothetical protein AVEN_188908-1 [Araneus ventricosus]